MLRNSLLILCVFSISGCAGMFADNAVTTVAEEGGKIVTTFTGAAVQRDLAYMGRGKYRDQMTEKMYKSSGVKIKSKMYALKDGSQAYLPEVIEVRAPHTYQQNIETRPPDHRGWASLDNIVNKVSYGFLGWLLGSTINHQSDAAGVRYYGDYNSNSFNPVDNSQPYIPQ